MDRFQFHKGIEKLCMLMYTAKTKAAAVVMVNSPRGYGGFVHMLPPIQSLLDYYFPETLISKHSSSDE